MCIRDRSDAMANMTQCSFPTEKAMGGWNNLCVTQKLVDAYYMVDGRDKNDASKEYPYHVANGTVTDDYFSTSAEEFSGYTIPMGVYGMYLNRCLLYTSWTPNFSFCDHSVYNCFMQR